MPFATIYWGTTFPNNSFDRPAIFSAFNSTQPILTYYIIASFVHMEYLVFLLPL